LARGVKLPVLGRVEEGEAKAVTGFLALGQLGEGGPRLLLHESNQRLRQDTVEQRVTGLPPLLHLLRRQRRARKILARIVGLDQRAVHAASGH
jgi:hypothetical protein